MMGGGVWKVKGVGRKGRILKDDWRIGFRNGFGGAKSQIYK